MCFAVAQTSGEVNTNLHVVAFPNPVGVGQDVVVTFQLDKTSPTAAGVAGGDHFTNFMVTITKPDGTTEMKGPYTASAISGNYLMYTPTEAGKYTFKANFPGQWINVSATERYWYKPAESAVFELTVQQDPVLPYPDIELPTDYWTRPINAENKGWWQIADNWLMVGYDYNLRTFTVSSAFAPYTSAPDSAHVLWKKPIVFGGMVGGPFSDTAYYTGLSYEQHYNPLVLNGRIIYTEHYPTSSASHSVFGTRCVDLYTGEEIWNLDGKNIAFAQILQFDSPNEHGAIPHLWSTSGTATNNTWIMYDAFTGKQMLTITNITMGSSDRWGTVRFGPNGELLTYTITGSSDARRIILWNSTKALVTPSAAGVAEYYSPVAGSVIDGRRGIEWNVSIPPMTQGTELIAQISGGYILTSNWTASSARMGFAYEQRAYPATIERLSDGSYPDSINYLWSESRDVYMAAYKFSKINEGIYTMFDEGRLQHFAYDIKTGHELWRTEPLEPGWAMFSGYNTHIAYGKLYASGYDGYVRAYDITSGNQVWEYFYGSAGYETPYGTWPTYAGFNIADGKYMLQTMIIHPIQLSGEAASYMLLMHTQGKEYGTYPDGCAMVLFLMVSTRQ